MSAAAYIVLCSIELDDEIPDGASDDLMASVGEAARAVLALDYGLVSQVTVAWGKAETPEEMLDKLRREAGS